MTTTTATEPSLAGMFDLTGTQAIVTGAAMGIGLGIAECLVEAGADVLLTDVAARDVSAAAAGLSGPGRASAMHADVRDGAEAMVARCVEEFGGVSLLVNNAGIYPQTPILEFADEIMDQVLDVNVKGLVRCTRAAARRMAVSGGGSIVNIASIDSFRPSQPGLSIYDASKGAVLMLTRSLAREFAPMGIRVNGIAPGWIHTPGTERPLEHSGMTPEEMAAMQERFLDTIPMHRGGTPREIGGIAVFLASQAASYVTGAVVVADGGALLT